MPAPQQLDFQALADGVVRNNVGVDGILVAARARCEGDHVVFAATGQRLPAVVTAETTPAQPWLWFEVEGHGAGERVQARCLGASSDLAHRPETLPNAGPKD